MEPGKCYKLNVGRQGYRFIKILDKTVESNPFNKSLLIAVEETEFNFTFGGWKLDFKRNKYIGKDALKLILDVQGAEIPEQEYNKALELINEAVNKLNEVKDNLLKI